MASSQKTIFICGVKEAPATNNGAPNLIFSDIKKLKEEGFDVVVCLADPKAAVSETVSEVKTLLAEKKRIDGANIGFGVRGNPALTPLFEGLVNTVLEEVEPAPKMMFCENIDKLYVSVRRAFPKEGE